MLKHIKRITWFYLLVLVLGSVLPINNGEFLDNSYIVEIRSDYLIHTLVFLPLPLLLSLSLKTGKSIWIKVILTGLIAVGFCEGVQMLIPYRTFNINDLLAGVIGVFIGLIPALFVWRRWARID